MSTQTTTVQPIRSCRTSVYVHSISRHVCASNSHALVQFRRAATIPLGTDPEAAMWSDLATAFPLTRERLRGRYNALWENHKDFLEGQYGLYVVCDSFLKTFIPPNHRPLTVPIVNAAQVSQPVVALLARDYLDEKARLLRDRAGAAAKEAEEKESAASRTWNPWQRWTLRLGAAVQRGMAGAFRQAIEDMNGVSD